MAHSAACSSSASQPSPTRRPITETPHQPLSFLFLKQPFGKKDVVYIFFSAKLVCFLDVVWKEERCVHSFQPSRLPSWTWLHYDDPPPPCAQCTSDLLFDHFWNAGAASAYITNMQQDSWRLSFYAHSKFMLEKLRDRCSTAYHQGRPQDWLGRRHQ